MPRLVSRYKCDYCDDTFKALRQCVEHECSEHLRISVEVYKEWKKIKEEVKSASSVMLNHCNAETRHCYDLAVSKLVEFETTNGLLELEVRY